MATLPLAASRQGGAHYLLARSGDDFAFVAESWSDYGSWYKQRARAAARLVRRSTIASCTSPARRSRSRAGCARSTTARTATSVRARVAGHVQGRWTVGNQIARARRRSIAIGGFDTKFTLPKTPNLGYASVDFEARRGSYVPRIRSRSRSSAGPSSRCRRTRATGRSSSAAAVTSIVSREVLRRRPAAGRAGQLVRHREPDHVHAAEPRRLRVRPVARRGGAIAAGATDDGDDGDDDSVRRSRAQPGQLVVRGQDATARASTTSTSTS